MTEKSNLFHRQQSDHDHKTNDHHDDNQDDDDEEVDEMKGSGVGGCRWNPTKEQIEMLESIYNNEGVRTPSAHQIQQITARLKVYGHIEGKNVFYWFQNHKARQRQKQRQERFNNLNINLNYHPNNINNNNNNNNNMNRFITPFNINNHFHTIPHNHGINGVNPMFHHNYSHNLLPNPNVICGPYYNVQQTSNNNDIGYHPLHSPQFAHSAPAIEHHALMRRSSSPSTKHMMQLPRGAVVPHGSTLTGYCAAMMTGQYDRGDTVSCMGARTLDLFPVHPTGILENKFDVISANNSATNSSAGSPSSESDASGDQRHQMFFDFFSTDHVLSENQ